MGPTAIGVEKSGESVWTGSDAGYVRGGGRGRHPGWIVRWNTGGIGHATDQLSRAVSATPNYLCLFTAVSADDTRGGRRGRTGDQRFGSTHSFRRARLPQTGILGSGPSGPRAGRDVGGRRGFRLSLGPGQTGPAMDAAMRFGMAVPPAHGSASAVATLFQEQPALSLVGHMATAGGSR